MTREEAEEYANNMTYRDAINNLMKARSIPYRKATFIKVNELLKTLEQEPMRDATPEERESIDKYIKSISKPTGINVFDFYEDNEQEELDFVQPKKTIPCTIKIQEPSEIKFWELDENDDCISRKAVLSLLADHFDNVFDMVKELPSVAISQDHDGCENCRYEDKGEDELPCCECQQNYKDKWKKKPHLIEVDDMIYKCSECGCDDIIGKCNFCPNCGAKMVEPQEISDRNLKMWKDIFEEEKKRERSNK